MMTGEFEYEDLIADTQFPELTYAFFLVFMIIMTIIVVNLLIGKFFKLSVKKDMYFPDVEFSLSYRRIRNETEF